MPIYPVQDKQSIAPLFDGWNETMIFSCLQDVMGVAYADSLITPTAAQISLGDFCFFAGAANEELLRHQPENLHSNFAVLVPQNSKWEAAIERCYGDRVTRFMRYATKKDPSAFDKAKLQGIVSALAPPYELRLIDRALYEEIMSLDWARDLCINYANYDDYHLHGLGVAVLKHGAVVSGASSYTSYRGGIEIEIDTRRDERRKGLASACGAALILECLKRDWYPSWDAQNKGSLALAERLGYQFDKEYPVYEIEF